MRGEAGTEGDLFEETTLTAGFEDEDAAKRQAHCRQPLDAGNGKVAASALETPEGTSPVGTVIMAR